MPIQRCSAVICLSLILVAVSIGMTVRSPQRTEHNLHLASELFARAPQESESLPSFAKPRSRFFRTSQIRIHYLEWNPTGNSTVVLLHGLNDTAEIWTKEASLIAAGHRVIAPDRRGSGRTDKPVNGYDHTTLAGDVLELIDGLKLSTVHLVGHSAGAGVVLTAAAKVPAKFETITLIDGGFWPKRPDSDASAPEPECTAKDRDCQRSAAIVRANMEYDPEPLYSSITTPALLVVSHPPESEAASQLKDIAEAHEAIKLVAEQKLKHGHFAVIRETGHWIQIDQPAALAKELLRFFTRKPPTPVEDNQ